MIKNIVKRKQKLENITPKKRNISKENDKIKKEENKILKNKKNKNNIDIIIDDNINIENNTNN